MRISLKVWLATLIIVAVIPFLSITIYLSSILQRYNDAYDEIVSNIAVVNSYNLVFKDRMDESIYKLVVGAESLEELTEDETLENPYDYIHDIRTKTRDLMEKTMDRESKVWLQSLLRNLNILEERVDDIQDNIKRGGHYDDNIQMLDDDIYILTELVQDDIQNYVAIQVGNMEKLRSVLNQNMKEFFKYLYIVVACIIIVVAIVVIFISFSITNGTNKLMVSMNKISEGEFDTQEFGSIIKDFKSLSKSTTDMAENLKSLVSTIQEDERQLRITELRLLQEQINPHFLYNTLDTIIWLIESHMDQEAEDMVISLSDFFRLVLNNGREIITIEDEKKHIESYLKIQQVRYRDILDYDIQIPEAMYKNQILKLTLQPVVENALYHGIKYMRAKGTIYITGEFKDDFIELVVKDNGVGMDQETLDKLNRDIHMPCQQTEGGFGLANVNERLKMHYGEEAGLSIASQKGEGTTVKIKVPIVTSDQAITGGDQ